MGDLQRFIEAQDSTYAGYATALQEINKDEKPRTGYGISFLKFKD